MNGVGFEMLGCTSVPNAPFSCICLFICLSDFLSFSLPLGVRGWLRLLIVALPRCVYYLFLFFLTVCFDTF